MVFEHLVKVLFQCRFGDSWEGSFFLVVGFVADDQVEVDCCGWVFVGGSAVSEGFGGRGLVGVSDWRREGCRCRGCGVGGVVDVLPVVVVVGGGVCFVVVRWRRVGSGDAVGVVESMGWCCRVGGMAVDVVLGVCCVVGVVVGVGGFCCRGVVGVSFVVGVFSLVVGVGVVVGVFFLVVGVLVVVRGVGGCGVVLVVLLFFFCVFSGGFFGWVNVVVFLALDRVWCDGVDVLFAAVDGSERGVTLDGLLVRVCFVGSGPPFLVCSRLGAGGGRAEHGGSRLLSGGVGEFRMGLHTGGLSSGGRCVLVDFQ